jgi:hypothetical protein
MVSKVKERRSYKRGNFSYKVKFRILPANEYPLSKKDRIQMVLRDKKQFKNNAMLTDKMDENFSSIVDFLISMDEKLNQILEMLSGEGEDWLTEQGLGVDISATGMRVNTDVPVEPGQLIIANLILLGQPFKGLDVVGEVIQVAENVEAENITYSAGIQFLDLEEYDKEKIIKTVFQEERESLRQKHIKETEK